MLMTVPVAHREHDMQRQIDKFAQNAKQFCSKIQIKNTECLYQPAKLLSVPPMPSEMNIKNEGLVQCKDFVYVGKIISENAKMENELIYRIGKTSAAFSKLHERL